MKHKKTIFIKWNKTILRQLAHSFRVFLQRNKIYLNTLLGKYIEKKRQEFENSGLITKTNYLRKKMKPFAQITVILCLISFAVMAQIIAIHTYHEDKKAVSKMHNCMREQQESTLAKKFLWAISRRSDEIR